MSLAEARATDERARGLFADWVYDITESVGKPVTIDARRVQFLGESDIAFTPPALTHPDVIDDIVDALVDAATVDPAFALYDVEGCGSPSSRTVTLRFVPHTIPDPHE